MKRKNTRKKIFISILVFILLTVIFSSNIYAAQIENITECSKNSISSSEIYGEKEIISYDNGVHDNIGVGLVRGKIFQGAIRLTPQEISQYDNWEIIGVKFYHRVKPETSETHSGNVFIYDEGTNKRPGIQLGNASWQVTGDGWKEIYLTNPIRINISRDIWVSVQITHYLAGEVPLGMDPGPVVPWKGGFLEGCCSPDHWYNLLEDLGGEDRNWNIGAIVSKAFIAKANGPYKFGIGEEIQFRGTAIGGVEPYTDWFWDFGDGDTSKLQNPTHQYSKNGIFKVKLTVTDSEGNVSTDNTKAIIIEKTKIEITDLGGILGVTAKIKNSGDYNASDISWKISVKGGFFDNIDIENKGFLSSLKSDESKIIGSGVFFGFGNVKINITINCSNAEPIRRELDGQILLFFVRIF